MTVPLPPGFRIELDSDVKPVGEEAWFGGSPARVLRLTAPGRVAWNELVDDGVRSTAGGILARRLTDAGIAHPRPPVRVSPLDVTIVIPVFGRSRMLADCLAALDSSHPVVVVDDGSEDPKSVADVCAQHGATLLRRESNGGPAAARNTALRQVTSEFVAFLDSDCVATSGWIEELAKHLADPLVAAVAPRIVPIADTTWVGRYTKTSSSLDLGDREARVVPSTRVSYVPTAAILVRREALSDVTRGQGVFDPELRYGEDVDLIWRLHAVGWRIRYEPAVQVRHTAPGTWPSLLAHRFRYGTSAAPLSSRHPAQMAPLVLQSWSTIAVAALLGRRPLAAIMSFSASVLETSRILRRARLPTQGVLPAMARAMYQTWLGVGRYATQFFGPVLIAVVASPGGATRVQRIGRRTAAASLLLGPPVSVWASRRNALDPVRFVAGRLVDDLSYGAGVWVGCARGRTTIPLRPRVARRPFTIDPAPSTTRENIGENAS